MAVPLKQRRRLMSEINVVPYIDVMLVLLVIFMITAPLLQQGIKVDLPKAATEPLNVTQKDAEPLVLSIDAGGQLYLNTGARPDSPQTDGDILTLAGTALRANPQRAVLVKGDRQARYGRIVEAMVLLQRAGATKLGFLTDPTGTAPRPTPAVPAAQAAPTAPSAPAPDPTPANPATPVAQ
jgi:biopolymer transport protein TolR